MHQLVVYLNLRLLAFVGIAYLLSSAGFAYPSFSQGTDRCDPSKSHTTLLANHCKLGPETGAPAKSDAPPKVNEKDGKPKNNATEEPDPKPAQLASLSDVKMFLLSLAQDAGPNTPPPFDKFDINTFVRYDDARNAYYLVFPFSHKLSDTSIQKISARLESALPRASQFLSQHHNVTIEIEVHTDGIRVADKMQDPNCHFSDNLELSKCRADYIRDFIEHKGIKNISVVARGDGEARCYKTKNDCEDSEPNQERQVRLVVIVARR